MKNTWKISTVKKNGRHLLRANFFACFISCLAVTFIIFGATSVSETVNSGENIMSAVADSMPGTPVADVLDTAVEGIEDFKKAASIGESATQGTIGPILNKISAARGIKNLFVSTALKAAAGDSLSPSVIEWVSFGVAALIYVFIGGILNIGLSRMLLEAGTGCRPRVRMLFFVYGVGKTRHVALIVFLRILYLVLWAFTIVGLPIKYYSYRLVPWLIAENPNLTYKEVFKLSASLMYGNKWKMFLYDLSFLPWMLLSIVTFGITRYLWLDPYYATSNANLFVQIKGESFALQELEYRHIPEKLKELAVSTQVKPQYSIINIAFMFIVFSFMGWLYECAIYLINDHTFINRGTMYGPWIPIYGVGGLVIVLLVNHFYKHPVLCFFLIIAVCAPVEYIGAAILWNTRHLKYWDYTGYFLNLQGRICLESMLAFAIMGLLSIYFLIPFVDKLLNRIPLNTRKILLVILYAAFGVDAVFSHLYPHTGEGITSDVIH